MTDKNKQQIDHGCFINEGVTCLRAQKMFRLVGKTCLAAQHVSDKNIRVKNVLISFILSGSDGFIGRIGG